VPLELDALLARLDDQQAGAAIRPAPGVEHFLAVFREGQ